MNKPKKILHLTDLHLFTDKHTKLIGINPFETLERVVSNILNNIDQNNPDLLILTGDVSQDFSKNSYKIAKEILQQFRCPIISTLGNHDTLKEFSEVLGAPNQVVTEKSGETTWRLITLNSHWAEHVGGRLAKDDLDFLDKSLSEDPNNPTIIFLHHQVLPANSVWIDKIGLENSEEFLKIIDKYNNIKAVICGHVHQETSTTRQGVTFLSTPSTSWQFEAHNDNFKIDTLMPGYRWINLNEDGSFQTEVIRIEHDDSLVPDTNIEGY